MPQNNLTEQIAQLLGVEFPPSLDPSAIKSLQKALPGYKAVADDAARFCQNHTDAPRLDEVRTSLEQGLADVARLEPVEHLLQQLYLSIYHQHLRATAKCMEGLYDTTRRIRDFAEAFPEIKEEGQPLLDFMKAFRPGRKKGEYDGVE
ncbi:MAG: hypothetical protein WGN25_05710 [Candidatus Electrothrix sp. GW3-4]|uniref:hypothetical protein n=1 Tax=Candidatus Electrothrix sp. GW3-4 TaxID=3126740 RepID=UPI0030D2247C